jgi:hypothetical protein
MKQLLVWGKVIPLTPNESRTFQYLTESQKDTMRIRKYLELPQNAGNNQCRIYHEILRHEQARDRDCVMVGLRRLLEICRAAARKDQKISRQLRLASRNKRMACLLMDQHADCFFEVLQEIYDSQTPLTEQDSDVPYFGESDEWPVEWVDLN